MTSFGLLLLGCLVVVTNARNGQRSNNDDVMDELYKRKSIPCLNSRGQPQRCVPMFENAAYQKEVIATNTCGMRRREAFCVQTQSAGELNQCNGCDNNNQSARHPATYMTDNSRDIIKTWWQSQTMRQGVGEDGSPTVNLTLSLGKTFEITYVRLRFFSSRPESFAIYKRTNSSSEWEPYQYYSASCGRTYKMPRNQDIRLGGKQTTVLCTDKFSDITPLSGGTVAFSTLTGRDAGDFENNLEIQEWVTASDIRIVLKRMNTFGDEVFGNARIESSYYYAISDFAVGARCMCNGHASRCTPSTGRGEDFPECECEHNTKGVDCGECMGFYNNKPWRRATRDNPQTCEMCNCNGNSDLCVFNQQEYERTGNGGQCIDCKRNTQGVNCQKCIHAYYNSNLGRSERLSCTACNCNKDGSAYVQCNEDGTCRCKSGVTGDKCDRCLPNYYGFGPTGCRPCSCNPAGQVKSELGHITICDERTGKCNCKKYVEGQECDKCKNGYYSLTKDNVHGCRACFCYGQTSDCERSTRFTRNNIESRFYPSRTDGFTAVNLNTNQEVETMANDNQMIQVSSQNNVTALYFVFPAKYLGDQKYSYGGKLSFDFKTSTKNPIALPDDVIIESEYQTISAKITSGGEVPGADLQRYEFTLSEEPMFGWSPRLTSLEFMKVLVNVKAIRIRATYSPLSFGFIGSVSLQSAVITSRAPAWKLVDVEQCNCPSGYGGQFCERCAPGFYRQIREDPFSSCIPCNCNSHSGHCDMDTGECNCEHNTAGKNCQVCAKGYYGNAMIGTPGDCRKCDCPDNGECIQLLNGDMACINCKNGYTGNRCDYCLDGFYGNPKGEGGPVTECKRCECNNNIDNYAIRNCDSKSGECLKCIRNTSGRHCENCLPDYYGNALMKPNAQCMKCSCDEFGSVSKTCDPVSGQCTCKRNVKGITCSSCVEGTYNLQSGEGCLDCNCDVTGSTSRLCNVVSGQCSCRSGVTGRRCDQCVPEYFGLDANGCKACNCDPAGSISRECDVNTGACVCKPNIQGRACDQCMENKYRDESNSQLCMDCPVCYNLVQDRVNAHRRSLETVASLLKHIKSNPRDLDNEKDFRGKLKVVMQQAEELVAMAKQSINSDDSLNSKLQKLRNSFTYLRSQCNSLSGNRTLLDRKFEEWQQLALMQIDSIAELQAQINLALDNNEGYELIEDVRYIQNKMGQDSKGLGELAKKAENAAVGKEDQANSILSVVVKMEKSVKEFRTLATDLFEKPKETKKSLSEIGNKVFEARLLHEQVKNESKAVLHHTETTYSDSLAIKNKVDGMENYYTDIPNLTKMIKDIKIEAKNLLSLSDVLSEENKQTLDIANSRIKEAEMTLKLAEKTQQTTDDIYGNADAARGDANNFTSMAEQVLEEAKKQLQELKDFNSNVEMQGRKSSDAFAQYADVERRLNEVNAYTLQATTKIGNSLDKSILALDIALGTEEVGNKTIIQLSKLFELLKSDGERLDRVEEESARLEQAFKEALDLYNKMAAIALNDDVTYESAVNKAAIAKVVANQTVYNVETALTLLEEIKKKLDELDSVDMDQLANLEEKLESIKKNIKEQRIKENMVYLKDARSKHDLKVRSSTNEYILLRNDVANLKQIRDTIPTGCYKNIELEKSDG